MINENITKTEECACACVCVCATFTAITYNIKTKYDSSNKEDILNEMTEKKCGVNKMEK